MQTRVMGYQQVSVLLRRLEEAGIHHGDEVRADITGLRVLVTQDGRAGVFFCGMGPIWVNERLSCGAHGALPSTVNGFSGDTGGATGALEQPLSTAPATRPCNNVRRLSTTAG